MINDIGIDLYYFGNLANIEDIRRKWISIVNLLKFIFNKNILNKLVVLSYNQVCNQILYFKKLYVFFFLSKLNASKFWPLTKIKVEYLFSMSHKILSNELLALST